MNSANLINGEFRTEDHFHRTKSSLDIKYSERETEPETRWPFSGWKIHAGSGDSDCSRCSREQQRENSFARRFEVIRFWIRWRILSSERNFIFFIAIFNFSGTCFHYKIFLYLSAKLPQEFPRGNSAVSQLRKPLVVCHAALLSRSPSLVPVVRASIAHSSAPPRPQPLDETA